MPLHLYNLTGNDWVRLYDWLPLPNVLPSEDKMVGLYAVFNTQSEFVAFTATGNFSVDWGDGSAVDNVASGVQAQHQYDYAAISASTLSTREYKQVIITITPQAGQQLLSVDINKRHTSASAQVQASNWLDITCSCNPASTLGFSSASSVMRSSMLEQITILNGQLRTDFTAMLANCYSLRSLPMFDTSSATLFTTMLTGCYNITHIPLLNSSLVTSFSSTFNSCFSLLELPLFDTSSCTTFTSMLSSCFSLLDIPLFDTSSGITFTSMLNGCRSITKVPLFDTSNGTTFTSMLNGCRSLPIVPAFDMSSATVATDIFTDDTDIARSLVTGLGVDHSYLNCNLSATALNEIYTNLPVVVGKTITVTGNYGVVGDNPAIATGKGWTVVG